MTASLFASLCAFSIVTSVTPGPNNLMLLASGVNFGFRRSLPHTIGVSLGFFALLAAVGLGLGALLSLYPIAQHWLGAAGAGYLLYLAYGVATSGPTGLASGSMKKPLMLFEAALFQFVNPKAWIMALTVMAIYADASRPFISSALVSAVFALLNWPCVTLWVGFGVWMRGFLADPARLVWFNRTMAVLLLASLAPMWVA